MQDKIEEINKMNKRIQDLKSFLRLCQTGSGDSEYKDNNGNSRQNVFTYIRLHSRKWTGTYTCYYEQTLTNDLDISLLVDFVIEPLEIQIEKLEIELANKLK